MNSFLRAAKLVALCSALIVFCAMRLPGQIPAVPSPLTLQAAIELAAARNPLLAAAGNEIQALEGDKLAAGQRLNPLFSFQAEDYPLNSHPGPVFGNQQFTFRLDYEIERGGRRQLRLESAQQAIRTQQLTFQDQLRRLALEVKLAFTRVLLAKSDLEASRAILEQAEGMIELNRIRLTQGDISPLELHRIEVEKLRFQDDVFQAELSLRNAKAALLALLDAPDIAQDVELAGSLSPGDRTNEPDLPLQVSLSELMRLAFEKRPDRAAALQDQSRVDTEARLQRALRSSNITIGGGYKRNLMENSFVVGVSIPLKIFSRNEGGILRAEAERRKAAYVDAALRKQIELEVQQAHNAVEINRQRVEYIRTQHLKKAEEASRTTLAAYHLGGANLMDYLDAQRSYRDALRVHNQALFNLRVSLYELAGAIGSGAE